MNLVRDLVGCAEERIQVSVFDETFPTYSDHFQLIFLKLEFLRFKVMRCVHESEGDVVMKLFIHRPGSKITLTPPHPKVPTSFSLLNSTVI